MTRQPSKPASILITGASNGIGAALARAYAGPGVFLAISGRDAARLEGVAAALRARGATVDARVIDVTDAAAMRDWIGRVDAAHPLDLVIANAGTARGAGGGEGIEAAREILMVNLMAAVETALAIVPAMLARGDGQIALVSSLAGFVGVPNAASYAASKAGLRVYGEGLRVSLRRKGVRVNVVCPGFVRTDMVARNKFWMPGLMDVERAARIIVRGLARNRGRIAFPWFMHVLATIGTLVPDVILRKIMRRMEL